MTTTDLTDTLMDCLDELAELIYKGVNAEQQQALRLSAGSCVLQMQECMDDLDYEYALHVCEIGPDMAAKYKSIYLASIREKLEAMR